MLKISVIDANREVVDTIPIIKYCTSCGSYKPSDRFRKDKRLELNLACYCKDCDRERGDAWRKQKPEKQKEYKLLARFGITYQQYLEMLESQNYKCKICGTHKDETVRKVLCVDHNHETGRIRGSLCDNCNKGLGHFYDETNLLKNAIEYLSATN